MKSVQIVGELWRSVTGLQFVWLCVCLEEMARQDWGAEKPNIWPTLVKKLSQSDCFNRSMSAASQGK